MKTKKLNTKILLFAAMAFLKAGISTAQDADNNADIPKQVAALKEGDSHFMVVGLTTFGFMNQATTNNLGGGSTKDKINSLGDADRFEFSPMFLWRHGDKMLIEFEPSWDGNSAGALGVNWASVSYYAAPNFIVRGGYIVLPFGTYTKRLAAGWINKLPSDPIGVDVAGSDFGVEAEGGLALGSMKCSYDIAVSNGFQLNPDGTIANVGISAISRGKTVCGRLGWLPLSNSSLELGVSGLMGSLATPVGDTNVYNKPMVTMYAGDINFIQDVRPFQLNFKGQYTFCSVNSQSYINPDITQPKYTFTNNTSSYFAQLAIKPSQIKNKILRKFELAFRYTDYISPKNSTWGQNYKEMDLSLNYWLSWRTVVKFGYENINSDGTTSLTVPTGLDGTSTGINRVILQFSTEF